MAVIDYVASKGKDREEPQMSDRETHLLKALLHLLLYVGVMKQGDDGKGLFFISPESMPTKLPNNMPINWG